MTLMAAIMDDPAKEAVLKYLGSYFGMSIGVALLISGLKSMKKEWVDNREPILTVILTFALGIAAKFALPEVYGVHTAQSWVFHAVALAFVAVGAGSFHDKVLNAIMGKKGNVSVDTLTVGPVGIKAEGEPKP